MLLTYRKLLQSKAIPIETIFAPPRVTSASRMWWAL